MTNLVFNRCLYVVEEIDRVERACEFLGWGDFENFGRLMYECHDGLSIKYQVSCDELD